MNIENLSQHEILAPEAIRELKRLRINTVEALLARAQDEKACQQLASRMRVQPDAFPRLLERAQGLVPNFDPRAKGAPVARGALKPPGF